VYLVGDEESCEIVVAGESIDDGCECLVLRIRPLRIRLLDLSGECIDVEEQINPCIRERLHTSIVIPRGINMVRYAQVSPCYEYMGYFELH